MSVKIWCVLTDDDCAIGGTVLCCYRKEDEAKKALDYWNQGDYSYQWIEEYELTTNFNLKEFQ